MAIINITEPTELAGHEIAINTARRLDFVLIDHYFIQNILNRNKSVTSADINETVYSGSYTPETLKKLIINQSLINNVVILNAGGEILFHNMPGTFHVRINSKSTDRFLSRKSDLNITKFNKFIKSIYGIGRISSYYYDLQIKLDNMDTDFASELISKSADMKALTSKAGITWKAINKLKKVINNNLPLSASNDIYELKIPDFAHASEREFAKMLDYYRIRWEYEPKSFILEKDSNSRIKEEFTPDFYLPDMDMYIELTTMKQKLVTNKNRKLKKLKRLYPDVNIKIFYGKDYKKLLHRFGIK